MAGTFFTPASGDKFRTGDIVLRPAYNPAVLETCLWNEDQACSLIRGNRVSFRRLLAQILKESQNKKPGPKEIKAGPFTAYPLSIVCRQKTVFSLIQFKDGQLALSAISESGRPNPESLRGTDIFFQYQPRPDESEKEAACLIKTNLKSLRHFLNRIAPETAPRALGNTPRLGIGSRMSVLAWPGVFQALQKGNITANPIQNSVERELAPLSILINRTEGEYAHLPGLGRVPVGHTGASIRGLWLYGMLAAMMAGHRIPYGADADHIPVKKRGNVVRINQAKRLLEQSRDYTLFTLDTSALFDYRNPQTRPAGFKNVYAPGTNYTKKFIFKNPGQGRDFCYRFSPDEVKRYSLKYGPSLEAAGELYQYLQMLKGETKFDFEFSMDERPGEISAPEAVTSAKELIFVINELRGRGAKINQIAPNFGVEKGVDYRLADGLDGLKGRIAEMLAVARETGVLLDVHSGDDLSRKTCRAIAEVTGGKMQFKISPRPQEIFAETLFDTDRVLFNRWWSWTLTYARKEAAAGSVAAKPLLEVLKERLRHNPLPSPHDGFFHYYSFAVVGLKDNKGCYRFREKFYRVTEKVKEEYGRRITNYVLSLAETLRLT